MPTRQEEKQTLETTIVEAVLPTVVGLAIVHPLTRVQEKRVGIKAKYAAVT